MQECSSTKISAVSREKVVTMPRPPDATDPLTQLRMLQQLQKQPRQPQQQHRQQLPHKQQELSKPKTPLKPRSLELVSVAGRKTVWAQPKSAGKCRSVDEFEKLNEVGKGTYGVVYRARDRENGTIVALKKVIFDQEQEGYPMTSLREIMLLSELRHDNVVTILDVVVGRSLRDFFVVMEYCEHELAALLDSMVVPFSPSDVKCLMHQLLEGLAFCHERYVIHRDMKLSNLLLTSNGILKIGHLQHPMLRIRITACNQPLLIRRIPPSADFGLAREFSVPTEPMSPKVVTLWYRAPELLFGETRYTTAIDLWAVGCIFGELLTNAPLLPGEPEQQQVQLIVDLLGTPTDEVWAGFSSLPNANTFRYPQNRRSRIHEKFATETDNTRHLLSSFLRYDPKTRISARKSLKHPYFSESPLAKDPRFLPTHPDPRMVRREPDRQRQRQHEEGMERSLKRHRGRLGHDSIFAGYEKNPKLV